MSSSRQRHEDAHDLGRQVIAGAVFNFVDLDGLGGEQEDAGSGERLADHEADKANLLAREGTDLGGQFRAAVADDCAVEIGKLEIGYACGCGGAWRQKIAGVAVQFIPFYRCARPSDLSRRGWGLAGVGEKARETNSGEGKRD